MHNIGEITEHLLPTRPQPAAIVDEFAKSDARTVPRVDRGEVDRADFSELARRLSLAGDGAAIRVDKVAEIQSAIERNPDGFIAERLEATVKRLSAEFHDLAPRR